MKKYSVDNIRLDSLREENLDALVAQANNKKIWMNLRDMFPHPYSIENGKGFISMVQNDKKNIRFAIKYGDAFAGMIGLFPQDDVYKYNAELGYWIGEEYWGKGIGTKAVQLVCEYCFSETDLNRIFASIFSYNKASMRVLEKNGFQNEGIGAKAVFKDGNFYDEVRYARIKEGATLRRGI